MQHIYDLAHGDFDAVNKLIGQELHSHVHLVEDISQYIVAAGGKRLRPLLVLLVARACGYQGTNHHVYAAVIEFLHTATLLHDDVVDTSALRRGRPTANAQWGNAPSVLVGDFIYSRAFQMLVRLADMRLMRLVADTTNVIAEGEVLQLERAGNPDTSEQVYFDVIRGKTAALFEAAAEGAALIAGQGDATATALRAYGAHLGLAFQLIDDALDYEGSSEELGKNVGDDLAEGKPTLPLILTMRNGSPEQAALVREAILNKEARHLAEIQRAVVASGGLEGTHQAARQQSESAIAQLATLPASPYKTALEELARFSISRRK